jgi:putative hemolysin
MARSADEVRAAQRLRFEVFNLELNEGLAESPFTGLDIDPFDAVCQHQVLIGRPRTRKDLARALREQIVAMRS